MYVCLVVYGHCLSCSQGTTTGQKFQHKLLFSGTKPFGYLACLLDSQVCQWLLGSLRSDSWYIIDSHSCYANSAHTPPRGERAYELTSNLDMNVTMFSDSCCVYYLCFKVYRDTDLFPFRHLYTFDDNDHCPMLVLFQIVKGYKKRTINFCTRCPSFRQSLFFATSSWPHPCLNNKTYY